MAQVKPEINKSQAIRDFVAKNPMASYSEVVAALAKQSTKVSKDLVYVVKGKMKAKKHREQREKAAAVAASSDFKTNKSAAIRAMLKANPKMKAKDVVSALADKGIMVTANKVYFIKGTLKGKKKKQQKMVAQVAAITVATAPASTSGDAVKTILKVKGWAAEVGGMKKLKALVEALSE